MQTFFQHVYLQRHNVNLYKFDIALIIPITLQLIYCLHLIKCVQEPLLQCEHY